MRHPVRLGIAAGVATILLLTLAALWEYQPPLASRQVFSLVLPEPRPGASEPLVVTGERENGDFFYVRFLADQRVAFGYDRWGRGGPLSRPASYRPGAAHRLELELPSLQNVIGNPRRPAQRLRVVFDGETLLDQPLETGLRKPGRLWFGENPLGGSSCGATFRGTLKDERGTILAGRVARVLSRWQRFAGWMSFGYAQAALILGAGAVAGWSVARVARRYLAKHGARRR